MKLNNRTIIGIILMVETLIMFLLTISLWDSIFSAEHLSEWDGEDESVVLFSIFLSLYFFVLTIMGVGE